MPEQKNRQEWFFKWITPLQAMRLCVAIVIVCMCVALGSAVAWCFSRLNNSAVTYDYKYVSSQEYLQQNGSTVLSYDEEKNQIAFMMNEDLINTVLNAYLQSQNYMLGDYKIYEMVYRQKEEKFYFQLQAGLFRVPARANVEATWDRGNQQLVLAFSNVHQGREDSLWASWTDELRLPSLRISAEYLEAPQWLEVDGVELNTNEMLLYFAPNLSQLMEMVQERFTADPVYLGWQNALENCPQPVRRLYQIVQKESRMTREDMRNFIKMFIDRQDELAQLLAVMDSQSAADFLEEYRAYITESVTEKALTSRQEQIKQSVKTVVARELKGALEEYIAGGIGVVPDAMKQPAGSTDNSYVNFTDGARLLGTAIVVQAQQGGQNTEWVPEQTYVVDAGVIYDYNVQAFLTAEWMAQQYTVTVPNVNFLKDIRLYYQCESGEITALITEDDGTVLAVRENETQRLTVSKAEAEYPEYGRTPVLASTPAMDSVSRNGVILTLKNGLGEGEILSRYMSAASNSAFIVFSTEEHEERVRTAVLTYDGENWSVSDYDVTDYLQYMYLHPEINGTIFPKESLQDIVVRTIPGEGLQLLLSKAKQLNLATDTDTLDYYYYIDNYIYTHFSNGKDCVFQVSDAEEILACRAVESAKSNWRLPPFFVLESSRDS